VNLGSARARWAFAPQVCREGAGLAGRARELCDTAAEAIRDRRSSRAGLARARED
jgi:hypothetical protein